MDGVVHKTCSTTSLTASGAKTSDVDEKNVSPAGCFGGARPARGPDRERPATTLRHRWIQYTVDLSTDLLTETHALVQDAQERVRGTQEAVGSKLAPRQCRSRKRSTPYAARRISRPPIG